MASRNDLPPRPQIPDSVRLVLAVLPFHASKAAFHAEVLHVGKRIGRNGFQLRLFYPEQAGDAPHYNVIHVIEKLTVGIGFPIIDSSCCFQDDPTQAHQNNFSIAR